MGIRLSALASAPKLTYRVVQVYLESREPLPRQPGRFSRSSYLVDVAYTPDGLRLPYFGGRPDADSVNLPLFVDVALDAVAFEAAGGNVAGSLTVDGVALHWGLVQSPGATH